jgi:flagellar FliL protein
MSLRPITLCLLLSALFLSPLHAEESEEGEAPKQALYYAFEPAFVVNVQGGRRMSFMQVKVQLMSREPAVIGAVEENLPPLRDALIMLLSHQDGETLRNVQGREQIRQQALIELQRVLEEITGIKEGVEAVYFTELVIQ